MTREFKIVHEQQIDGTPEQVFAAATEGSAGWLWPVDIELKLGGAGPFGSSVTAWDPPHRYANHMDGENGFYNTLEFEISERPDGKSWLRYVHSGVIFEDEENQYEAAQQHTAFYQHTLAQVVKYFPGRQASFAEVQGPEGSGAADALQRVKAALGISDVEAGHRVSVTIEGLGHIDAEVDYLAENFVGLRTEDAMYRFFGRNAFGSVVGMTIHLFAGDASDEAAGDEIARTEAAAWGTWLNGLFG
ncbi:ATPase [Arthrobacter glacialis]|uniref:ATPase n=1 Tax=Arthrobacter glacialis TaxID=1664 RepID=UPI000CD49696|nr:ATPase [Arthrobacter glacialis]POH60270.1 ATPase [Arthrobacter glacialis]